jgi:DNA-directed RNA polymerase specialized sigma24 family protein
VRDKDSAKDVVQEVFVKLWRNRETLQLGDQIKHYLFRATSHTALNHLRSHRKVYRMEDFEQVKDIASPPGTETASFKGTRTEVTTGNRPATTSMQNNFPVEQAGRLKIPGNSRYTGFIG